VLWFNTKIIARSLGYLPFFQNGIAKMRSRLSAIRFRISVHALSDNGKESWKMIRKEVRSLLKADRQHFSLKISSESSSNLEIFRRQTYKQLLKHNPRCLADVLWI